MQTIDYNAILNRKIYEEEILSFLNNFDKNKNQLNEKRGIYLYGEPGIGKTKFVCNLLKDNGYDIIYYDSSDIRNKNIMELITNHNMANINVYTMFTRERKNIVIVIDDIESKKFIKSDIFDGKKTGYVFKTDALGTGYYLDNQ